MRVKSRYRYIKCVRVARRAPGVTFLSGTGYIVTDDSRPRADSPSGTVDCRWSLCKIRRRIITDERQRGAARRRHTTHPRTRHPPARASGESERRAPATGGLFGNNSESRKPGKYSPNRIRMPNLDTDSSIQRKNPQRRERGGRNRRTEQTGNPKDPRGYKEVNNVQCFYSPAPAYSTNAMRS